MKNSNFNSQNNEFIAEPASTSEQQGMFIIENTNFKNNENLYQQPMNSQLNGAESIKNSGSHERIVNAEDTSLVNPSDNSAYNNSNYSDE
jgi:hypothetical protein